MQTLNDYSVDNSKYLVIKIAYHLQTLDKYLEIEKDNKILETEEIFMFILMFAFFFFTFKFKTIQF